jgi:hypothetical protein
VLGTTPGNRFREHPVLGTTLGNRFRKHPVLGTTPEARVPNDSRPRTTA